MKIKIYVNTWGRYNDGLEGIWVKLGQVCSSELSNYLKVKLDDKDPEYFIQDIDGDFGLDELSNFFEINEKLYIGIDIEDDVFKAMVEAYGLKDALKYLDNEQEFILARIYDLYPDIWASDETRLGWYCEHLGYIDIPDDIAPYFDFEAYGRVCSINTNGMFTSYGFLEEL